MSCRCLTLCEVFYLAIVPDADIVAGLGEGDPGDVEPAVAGEELVGVGAFLEKLHQIPELSWVAGADVGSLTDEVL